MIIKYTVVLALLLCLVGLAHAYDQHITTYWGADVTNINNANDSDWNTYARVPLDKYMYWNVTISPPDGESFNNQSVYYITKLFMGSSYSAPVPYMVLSAYNYSSSSWRQIFAYTPQTGSRWIYPLTTWYIHSDLINTDNLTQFSLEGVNQAYYYEGNLSYSLKNIGLNNCSDGQVIVNFPLYNVSSYMQDKNYTMNGYFYIKSIDEDVDYIIDTVRWDNLSTTQQLCVFPPLIDTYELYGQLTYNVEGDIYNYFIPSQLVSNASPATINLYSQESTSSDILLSIIDESDAAISDAYLYIRKYDVGLNQDITIMVLKTDDEGYTVAPLVTDIQYYTFVVVKDGITLYSSLPTLITSLIRTIRVTTGSDYYTSYRQVYDIDLALTFTNASKMFELDYVDHGEALNDICLTVIYHNKLTETELYRNCSSDITSIIRYNYSSVTSTSGTYIAIASVIIEGTEYILDTVSYSESRLFKNWGDTGLFFGLGLLITLIMLGVATKSPAAIIVYAAVGIIFASLSTLISVPWEIIIIIVAMAGVATMLISRRNY